MCGAWLCHSWIFGLEIELLILSILMGLGAFLNALMCRIWGETGEEAVTADRCSRVSTGMSLKVVSFIHSKEEPRGFDIAR